MDVNIARLISILYRKNHIYMNAALKVYGITASEQPFVMYLYENNGATQEEMSAYLCIDKAATTRAVQSLIKKGYVTRQKDGVDKRYNRIYTTKLAERNRDEILMRYNLWDVFLTSNMDEETKLAFSSALEDMATRADQTDFRKEWTED